MAGNMPYYNEVICEGHYCPKDCESGCPYADEAMEFCDKRDEIEEVPWSWLLSYAHSKAKADPAKYSWLGTFLDEAMNDFTKEVMEEENDDLEPSDDYLEMGFDPYLGCYTEDC